MSLSLGCLYGTIEHSMHAVIANRTAHLKGLSIILSSYDWAPATSQDRRSWQPTVCEGDVSPALLCGRERAEAKESADLADVKLPSPVFSRGSSFPPFCSRTWPRLGSATQRCIVHNSTIVVWAQQLQSAPYMGQA